MTRRDFIGLADAMAEGIVTGKYMDAMCAFLARDNPRFDRERFEMFLRTKVAQHRNKTLHKELHKEVK